MNKVIECLSERSSGRGRTGKMRSFWDEKIHVVLENIKNKNITYNVKPEKDTNGRIRVPYRNKVRPCDNLLDNFNWNIKTELNHKKHRIRKPHLGNYLRKMIMRKKLLQKTKMIVQRWEK